MARKLKDKVEEATEVFHEPPVNTDVVDETEGVPLVEAAPEAPPKAAAPPAKVPEPKQYRVKLGGRIMHRGFMTEMKTGKVVDERHYDIDRLREQGIDLELL